MQQTRAKRVKDLTQLDGKGDPLRIILEIEIWPYKHVVYVQSRTCSGEWVAQSSLGFWDANGSPNQPDLVIVNKKKRENILNCGLCHSGRPQSKTERKWKER